MLYLQTCCCFNIYILVKRLLIQVIEVLYSESLKRIEDDLGVMTKASKLKMGFVVRKLFEDVFYTLLCETESMYVLNSNIVELALLVVEDIVISYELLTFLFHTILKLLVGSTILIDPNTDISMNDKVHLRNFHIFIIDNPIICPRFEMSRHHSSGYSTQEVLVVSHVRS